MAARVGTKIWVTLLGAALLVAGCSRSEEPEPGETISAASQSSTSATSTTSTGPAPMPTVRMAPEIPEELGEDAAGATAQTFLEMWVQFSPSNFDPKQAWFDSWDSWATADFRRDMRISADSMWSWTWNQSVKTCCVEFPTPVEVNVDGDKAVAKVTLTRWVLPLFATAADIEANVTEPEEKTYIVTLEGGSGQFLVSDVREAGRDDALPEVN